MSDQLNPGGICNTTECLAEAADQLSSSWITFKLSIIGRTS